MVTDLIQPTRLATKLLQVVALQLCYGSCLTDLGLQALQPDFTSTIYLEAAQVDTLMLCHLTKQPFADSMCCLQRVPSIAASDTASEDEEILFSSIHHADQDVSVGCRNQDINRGQLCMGT